MSLDKQAVTFLTDYQPFPYTIESIDLKFDIFDNITWVEASIKGHRNASIATDKALPLVLQGKNLILHSVYLDSKLLGSQDYILTPEALTIPIPHNTFVLKIKTEIHPEKNTELSGLFRSKSIFCTQCESQGFRRMMYYPDRPDVMAKFTTTICADKRHCPVLLSNGNCIEKGDIDQNRHFAKWEDPYPKPCYLFALVAGNLVSLEDYFVTRSHRLVTLKIFVETENQDKCAHAMLALKKAMQWDEETYGLEYDLDIYMIVAVNDFNMGAMENKGLNVFNAKYILASPESATDTDYQYIDVVVGHEYFHNWSGNRVTCRDWFQLSLKEGLTVFREHHFSADISKSPVSVIDNVRHLRSQQFAEDQSPIAHPVRPESYLEINNFYTTTIYEKGAELIRMLKIFLGWERFRAGMDLYFERHDGQAVTCDDFIAAMESVSKIDLTQFRLWYSQAGTPEISVKEHYDTHNKTYQLILKQSPKQPMMIPISIGLLGNQGHDLLPENKILVLNKAEQTFNFPDILEKPTLSILRNFSAPVKIHFERSQETLSFLLAQDSDDFNRWDAGQTLTAQLIWDLMAEPQSSVIKAPSYWLDAHFSILTDKHLDPALLAEMLMLPSMTDLFQMKLAIDIDKLFLIRTALKKSLAVSFKDIFREMYQKHLVPGRYVYSAGFAASRRLKNICLGYLILLHDKESLALAMKQWAEADNMTDSLGVLHALSNWEGPERETILSQFYTKWQHDPLVLDKWFRVQAQSELPDTLQQVRNLMQHPAFDIKNPNKVYALIGAFTGQNFVRFHEENGAGYAFLAKTVLQLDLLNPQVAARMVRAFSCWGRLEPKRQEKAREQLYILLEQKNLSKDVHEVVSKCVSVE